MTRGTEFRAQNHLTKKAQFFVFIFTFSLIYFGFFCSSKIAHARNCGGVTTCGCGDTVIENTTLSANLNCVSSNSHGLIVGASGVEIDGNGHSIIGIRKAGKDGNYGIYINAFDNVIIKNFSDIQDFNAGIYGYRANYLGVHDNFTNNNDEGIYLELSASSTLVGNTSNDNETHGIYLKTVSSSTIVSNTTNLNQSSGVALVESSFNYIASSTANSNIYNGFDILSGSASNTLENNIAHSNSGSGILISSSNANSLTGNNTESNQGDGILILSSFFSTLADNTSQLNIGRGIYLQNSQSSVLNNNAMSGNAINLFIYATIDANYNQTINTTNLVEGKSVYYLYNIQNVTYDSPAGGIGMFWCISCNNVTAKNATLSPNNKYGVYLKNSASSSIQNMIVNSNSDYGVYFQDVSSSTIQNVTTNSNTNYGVYLNSSNNNNLISNTAEANVIGVYIKDSSFNGIATNTINSNTHYGIYLESSDHHTLSNNTVKFNVYSGVTLNGSSYNSLIGNTVNENRADGINLDFSIFSYSSSTNNILTNNIVNTNLYSGINLIKSSNNTLSGNIANYNNVSGIKLNSTSTNNIIEHSILNGNIVAGLDLQSSANNTLTDNVMFNNRADIRDNSLNIYTHNRSDHNLVNRMMTFEEIDRTVSLNNQVTLVFDRFKSNGETCPNCLYLLSTNPAEIINTSIDGSFLTATFTPTRRGAYSLIVYMTDPDGNTTKRNVTFLVDAHSSAITKYYFRSTVPSHGQPLGTGIDSGSLLFAPPTGEEYLNCAFWTQNSPDELPSYPIADISSINFYTWYKAETGIYAGIQRLLSYDGGVDLGSVIADAPGYTWINKNFSNLNWMIDYPQNWYRVALKIRGANPYMRTTPAQPSYADFTYEYTDSPAIKSLSNTNINILSATAPADATSSAQVVIENPLSEATSTIITLSDFKRPLTNAISTVYSDATTTLTVSLAANSSSTLDAVALDITPSSGSITVALDTWNTSGNYYKKWTEESSAHTVITNHVVGNLKPNTNYIVKIDNIEYHVYTSNASGEISFNYDGGYSTKTFEVEEKIASSGGGGGGYVNPPAIGDGKTDISIPMDKTKDIGLLETAGINSLSYVGSIADFQTLVGRTYTIEKHRITIVSLDLLNKIITIKVESKPQTLTIKLSELAKVDLDSDKSPDISIKFTNLYVNRAELTIKSLIEPKSVTSTPITKQTAQPTKYIFKKDLKLGNQGNDVKELQKYLNANGFIIAKSGAGSKGKETTVFGPATKSALIKFQKAKKITPAVGFFGAKTRAAINK